MKTKRTIKDILLEAQNNGADVNKLVAEVERNYQPLANSKKTEYKKLDLETGMWDECKSRGITLTELLEEQDPSLNYDTGLNAFERQLACRGLKLSGPDAVTLDRFYDEDNRILFPEFIQQQIKVGRVSGRHTLTVDDLIAGEVTIDDQTMKAVTLDETQDFHAKRIGEYAEFPRIKFTTGEESIDLVKIGWVIAESYEHRRRIRMPVMAAALRVIGRWFERDSAEEAVKTLINGDGNSNAAFAFNKTTLNYNNLVEFWAEFHPYESTLLVCTKAAMIAILQLAEFKDPLIGSQFLNNGQLVTPLGHTMRRHDDNSSLLSSKILGVDQANALLKVMERNSSIVETDRIINGQWTEIAVSEYIGFARIFAKGAGLWDYS